MAKLFGQTTFWFLVGREYLNKLYCYVLNLWSYSSLIILTRELLWFSPYCTEFIVHNTGQIKLIDGIAESINLEILYYNAWHPFIPHKTLKWWTWRSWYKLRFNSVVVIIVLCFSSINFNFYDWLWRLSISIIFKDCLFLYLLILSFTDK